MAANPCYTCDPDKNRNPCTPGLAKYNIEDNETSEKENMIMSEMHLSAPWVEFYRKIAELFEQDEEVRVEYDNDTVTIKLYVANAHKADALAKLLPAERTFGNVTAHVNVLPGNDATDEPAALLRTAFAGNPALVAVETVCAPGGQKLHYAAFDNVVVQYFADNLVDLYGNISTLYQDIAKDVLNVASGVYFCTVPNDIAWEE